MDLGVCTCIQFPRNSNADSPGSAPKANANQGEEPHLVLTSSPDLPHPAAQPAAELRGAVPAATMPGG